MQNAKCKSQEGKFETAFLVYYYLKLAYRQAGLRFAICNFFDKRDFRNILTVMDIRRPGNISAKYLFYSLFFSSHQCRMISAQSLLYKWSIPFRYCFLIFSTIG